MYITRDNNGNIESAFNTSQYNEQEFLADNNTSLQIFLNPPINTALITEVQTICAQCTPFQKIHYAPVLSAILNAVQLNNITLLTSLANDTSVPIELQSIQAQLRALLTNDN